jgi:hypothetical protein
MKCPYNRNTRSVQIFTKQTIVNVMVMNIMQLYNIVSIRSTPYCKSQNNVVSLHGGIIFLILRQEYAI